MSLLIFIYFKKLSWTPEFTFFPSVAGPRRGPWCAKHTRGELLIEVGSHLKRFREEQTLGLLRS